MFQAPSDGASAAPIAGAEQPRTSSRAGLTVGWLTVAVATTVTSFLGFWGINENFHEGWHHPQLAWRLAGTLAYLAPMLIFMALGVIAVHWPRTGAALFAGLAAFAIWFFHASLASILMFAAPALVLGLGFLWGRPQSLRWVRRVMIGVPAAVVLVSGAAPAWKVATRFDDGDRGARHLTDNGVNLIWAPQGPGWPNQGMNWFDAVRQCRYLNADGTTLVSTPQDIWRLPTVEELVRSQCRHGKNCGGAWDAAKGVASYKTMPDKESPLWDPYSQVVYWWTSTEANGGDDAYFAAFNGYVRPRPKTAGPGYQGFRAVRPPPGEN